MFLKDLLSHGSLGPDAAVDAICKVHDSCSPCNMHDQTAAVALHAAKALAGKPVLLCSARLRHASQHMTYNAMHARARTPVCAENCA